MTICDFEEHLFFFDDGELFDLFLLGDLEPSGFTLLKSKATDSNLVVATLPATFDKQVQDGNDIYIKNRETEFFVTVLKHISRFDPDILVGDVQLFLERMKQLYSPDWVHGIGRLKNCMHSVTQVSFEFNNSLRFWTRW